MKKLGLYSFMALYLCGCLGGATTVPNDILGDVNGDGLVNETDFAITRTCVGSNETYCEASDVNDDNVVDQNDMDTVNDNLSDRIGTFGNYDLNKNNLSNEDDFAIVRNCFGEDKTTNPSCERADFNSDNVIDILDTDIAVANILPSATVGQANIIDLNGDGTVNMDDFTVFSACFSSPASYADPGKICAAANLDALPGVTTSDFAPFLAEWQRLGL